MKRWVRWLGAGLAVAGSAAFVAQVMTSLDITDLQGRLTPTAALALTGCTALYCLSVPLAGLAWQRLLTGLGHRTDLARLQAILLTTQVGKYLPGNVGQYLGRIAVSSSLGIPAKLLVMSMAYEVILVLFAVAVTALIAGALSGPGLTLLLLDDRGEAVLAALALALVWLAAIPTLGKVLPPLARRFSAQRVNVDLVPPLPIAIVAQVVAIFALSVICVGVGLGLLSLGLLRSAPVDFALLTAAFAIAWAAGFVTPGAPAGIGVREALMLVMLGPTLGNADAALLILALRVVTTLGDVLCFVAGVPLLAWVRRTASKGDIGQHEF